jgi:rod shape-determining protein MreB and related proteins
MRLPWSDELAIDLGTAHTHICVKGVGVVVREPSVIAFDAAGRRPVAVGLEAKRMLERDVEGVQVVRPIRGGMVADFDAAVTMLRHFLHQALGRRPLWSPIVVTSHPDGATPVERRALADAIRAGGGGQVMGVQRSLATALGAGVKIGGDTSQMVIDLGAGVTNVGVIAMDLATGGMTERQGATTLMRPCAGRSARHRVSASAPRRRSRSSFTWGP